ncbi:MAG: tRNA (adenosine(37)-N6)-threonylcarbamoyltransferase complex transferase subunit TsaD [Candidatus Omnitrophota bacterium]
MSEGILISTTMLVLGIETSCDETAAAVVKDGRKVLSNIVASSLKLHRQYGGVIPEIASRSHIETIAVVTRRALNDAGCSLQDLGLICVTTNPGLIGSLLVGISFARALSLALGIPVKEVDHVAAHLYANFLDGKTPQIPAVGLVVSGGHTSLYYLKNLSELRLIGHTFDDAAGEAFDKVAKILGLGYPGGPIIERLAKKGDPQKVRFSCAAFSGALNFSFSGIKTAVLYYVRGKWERRRVKREDICASFQEAVVGELARKAICACREKRVKTLLVGGGVAANSRLREVLTQEANKNKIKLYCPKKEFCLDNAAMVAGKGALQ